MIASIIGLFMKYCLKKNIYRERLDSCSLVIGELLQLRQTIYDLENIVFTQVITQ